ncbi:hypothetical protein BISU_1893 [Bifidobacterium subtile]|uniref:Uncharacterized protein n=2 Tax=Bifidobacterium subtile TaxID=77635 RepID=A0A087E976_9BIFI|nr:hypothetical protein BISU_1893 [Bifidobacterium subtile]
MDSFRDWRNGIEVFESNRLRNGGCRPYNGNQDADQGRFSMASTKKSNKQAKAGGKLSIFIDVVTMLSQFITPEMLGHTAEWLKEQKFSDKFVDLVRKIHFPEDKDPLDVVGYQCDAVEELIETKSADLSDNAPIGQWRGELGRIRRGVELLGKAPVKDRKKVKALEMRAKRLFDSAFTAAVN